MILHLLFLGLPLASTQTLISGPVDLTHYFNDSTIYWLNNKPFDFTKVVVQTGTSDDFFYTANEFETAEHGGTHLDAPYHFYRDGWKVGDIPVERFIGKAIYVNLRAKAAENADYEVLPEDFEQWEKKNGPMPENAIVLLDFGWTEKYNNKKVFLGSSDVNNFTFFHFPGLSKSGAQWLVDTGKVYGVGTDTASIDHGTSAKYKTHRLLAKNSLFVLEQLAFPKTALPAKDYKILALPMKIQEGTGAPCRVLAVP